MSRFGGTLGSDWSPDQIKQAAESYRAQGPQALVGIPPRSPVRNEIVKQAMQMSLNAGESGRSFGASRSQFSSDQASMRKIVPMYDAVSAWSKMVDMNGEILKTLAAKVDKGGMPAVERFKRAIKRGSDPSTEGADVAEFFAQLQIFNTEVARALTNPSLTGVVSDSARLEIHDLITRGASLDQIKRVVDRLGADTNNRLRTLEGQYKDIEARIQGGFSLGSADAGSKPAGIPATAKQAPDGKWYSPDPARPGKYILHE
jgi:hypothetical protein